MRHYTQDASASRIVPSTLQKRRNHAISHSPTLLHKDDARVYKDLRICWSNSGNTVRPTTPDP